MAVVTKFLAKTLEILLMFIFVVLSVTFLSILLKPITRPLFGRVRNWWLDHRNWKDIDHLQKMYYMPDDREDNSPRVPGY